jgi:hypothetical protein
LALEVRGSGLDMDAELGRDLLECASSLVGVDESSDVGWIQANLGLFAFS